MIANKNKMLSLMRTGALGNSLRTWYDITMVPEDVSTLSLRYSGDHGGSFCMYNVKRETLPDVVSNWVSRGAITSNIYANESAPDDKILVQGEIMESFGGIELLYSFEKGKMRDVLPNAKRIKGLAAGILLKTYMNPSSYDGVMELLEQYPGHVVEFGVYNTILGWCRGWNTIVWEVRNY